ncbi:MAG: alpha/beta fold hydrolase [Tenuifilaceae bacterium]
MKHIVYFGLITILLSVGSCSSPYKSLVKHTSMQNIEYPFDVKKVKLPLNGCEVAYIDEGKGPKTIIFIHGLGSYLPAWTKNVRELKNNFRCIAIDLPGYGKSSKEPHSGLMSYYAGVVKELIEQLDLGKVVLAGHSMGGQISITTALLYPEKVDGLVLVDPAGFEKFHEGQKQWFRDVMTFEGVKNTTVEGIQNNLATNFYRVPKDAEFMINDRISMRTAVDFDAYCYAVVQSVNGMVNEQVIDHLEKITQPTIIFFGENDNLIPNRYLNPGRTIDIAKYGAEKIKGSKLVMAPKCGHFMMFEKSEVFNSEVLNFLKN